MKTIKPILWWLAALVAIAIALLYAESDFLWKIQQYNLFLFSSLFFKQLMIVPGGMLSYLGAFFTQFFYYPWLGVLMLCAWWLLLLWLIKRTFNIPDQWNVVALIPIALLLTANTDLGYWVYAMKPYGYFFMPTIGTTAGVALLWLFRKLPNNLWLRTLYIVFVVLATYPLMGAYALTAALLMAIWTWRLSNRYGQDAIVTIAALLTIVVVPLFYYRFVYYQINIINIYKAALPTFTIIDSYPLFKIPYYLLAVCFLAFVVAFRKDRKVVVQENEKPRKREDKKGKREDKKATRLLFRWVPQGALMAALVAGVWYFWYKDDNFHHELRMQRCIEQADWEGVVEEGKKQTTEPTRAIVMMHNLALSRLGRQCNEMYKFPKGSNRSNTQLPVYMYNTAGILIYYQYGVLNESHRLCMEQGVNFGWNVELLHYLARCSLLGGETQATRKYLSLLRQTLFYGQWADHMETLLNNHELATTDKETGPITHMLHYNDILGTDKSRVEEYLMNMLSKTDSDDPYFQEQAVLATLWTRSPDDFWPRMSRYAQLHPQSNVPRIFMEAACLFGHLQNLDFIKDLPDKNVLRNFETFMQQMKKCEGKSIHETRKILYPYYGETYFYEYFFLKDITYF